MVSVLRVKTARPKVGIQMKAVGITKEEARKRAKEVAKKAKQQGHGRGVIRGIIASILKKGKP